jgi:hypothetical protein
MSPAFISLIKTLSLFTGKAKVTLPQSSVDIALEGLDLYSKAL